MAKNKDVKVKVKKKIVDKSIKLALKIKKLANKHFEKLLLALKSGFKNCRDGDSFMHYFLLHADLYLYEFTNLILEFYKWSSEKLIETMYGQEALRMLKQSEEELLKKVGKNEVEGDSSRNTEAHFYV